MGTAGWTLPSAVRERFAGAGTQLERYARVFSCVEINSSFYRPHRRSTYERWAASVPAGFRFSLKLPKEITHTRRLANIADPLARFLDASSGLARKRDVILVQLPPSLAYDDALAASFLEHLSCGYAGRIACEPRHPSWFSAQADTRLASFGIARVAADPAVVPDAARPGGAAGWSYLRLHGSPRTYYSGYDDARLAVLAADVRAHGKSAWCIFDNTAAGAATGDALRLEEMLSGS